MPDDKTPELAEQLTNLGHLSAAVGHHVINAFSAVVSNAELLRFKPALADPAVLADVIVRTAVEASTVARRLIDYTRAVTSLESDRCTFPPTPVPLDRLAAEVAAEEAAHRGSSVRFDTRLSPVPLIRGQVTQLREMLAHLLENAYEALPRRGGTIALSTSTDARGWVVLEIRDHGAGMPPEVIERAVEPFFTTKPGRLGVGLSIANGIWRRHHGSLSLRSQPGDGTTLRLCVEPWDEANG